MKLCGAVPGLASLGSRISMLELGRSGQGHVANFEDPQRIPQGQIFQTEHFLKNHNREGLEFVRSWDAFDVSIISLTPFMLSLTYAGIWIGVFTSRGVDTQIVVQTAFTVSSYTVTAGR